MSSQEQGQGEDRIHETIKGQALGDLAGDGSPIARLSATAARMGMVSGYGKAPLTVRTTGSKPAAMAENRGPEAGVLLITGGARGIGRAIAELAAERGWAVSINYRTREDAAREVVDGLRARGARALCVQGDVSEEPDVVRMFDATESGLGPVTAVVNNAGIVAPSGCLADTSAARLRRVVDVNVFGALLVAREAARRLSTARGGPGGSLVNISSIASRLGSPGEYVDYAASKGALDALTLGLGRELAREGVRVNGVRPGIIDTEIHSDSGNPDRAHQLGRNTPMGRPGTAAEVALAVLWLLGDEASYLTASIVDVSGGR